MSAIPTETEAWILQGQNGADSLEKIDNHRLPVLGDHDVLVQLHAASLNYRDIAIAKALHSLPLPNPTIPSSDGAGIILATGPKVTSLHPGDEVCTHLLPHKPPTEPVTLPEIAAGLGHGTDGTLRRSGVFHESAIVRMPRGLSFLQASALPCAGLTAWNALFGLLGRETGTGTGTGAGAGALGEGGVVLVQGSGGVSVLAMQFALAAGATVIATTSSPAKAQKLASLGARHVLNYKTDPTWGETAKSLTPDGKGVDVVVDVGGLATLPQSLKAVRPEGLVSITGLLGGGSEAREATLLDCLVQGCVARGVILGTRKQFEEMNAFIEEKGVRPVVDERVFGLGEVRDSYEYLMGQRHFSKVCIQLDR